MRALNNDQDYKRTKRLMNFMRKWRITITKEYFTYLIVNCARVGDIQRASTHIYQMKKEYPDYDITPEMYNGHIAFWASKGKLYRARNIIKGIKQKGLTPIASNFEELILNYRQSGAPESDIEDIRREMIDYGYSDSILDKE